MHFKRFMCAFALLGAVGHASAQDQNPLPEGVMTFVVPLSAGGPADALARTVAEGLSKRIERTIIIENRVGAGGNIGAALVARAAPDGINWLYTIDTVLTVNPHLYPSQGFDPNKDLTPVARIGDFSLLLAVNAKAVPAKTFAELVAFSQKTNINFASAGIGSPGHLAFEYLRMVSDLKGAHVPYRGAAPALQDIISGNVEAGFVVSGPLTPHVKSGALRALAVSSQQRVEELPDVPTAGEAGIKDFEARFAMLLLTQAAVDPKIKQFVAGHLAEVMKDPQTQKRFNTLQIEPTFAPEQVARAWISSERQRWGEVIKKTGVSVK